MKPNNLCKVYTFLYRVIPYPAWQVRLIHKHFSHCPHCQEEMTTDEQLKDLLVSPKEAQSLPEVWPYVNRRLEEPADSPAREREKRMPRKWQWQWRWTTAAVIGVFLVMAVVFHPFSPGKKQPAPDTRAARIDSTSRVVVKSVKIGSKAAKYYFFQSKDPDKLIIWAQRSENNGG